MKECFIETYPEKGNNFFYTHSKNYSDAHALSNQDWEEERRGRERGRERKRTHTHTHTHTRTSVLVKESEWAKRNKRAEIVREPSKRGIRIKGS